MELVEGLIVTPNERFTLNEQHGLKQDKHKGKTMWKACPCCGKPRWVRLGFVDVVCTDCNRKKKRNWPQGYEILSGREYFSKFGIKVKGSMILYPCKECGEYRWIPIYDLKRKNASGLCHDCFHKYLNKLNYERRLNFKPYRRVRSDGYIHIRINKDDPYISMAHEKSRMILEHRYIMAQHLGRCLGRTEIVHHINEVRDDNRIENLELISIPHHLLHCHTGVTVRAYIKLLEDEIIRLTHIVKQFAPEELNKEGLCQISQ